MALKTADRRKMQQADPEAIRQEFARLRSRFASGQWIKQTNKYRANCVRALWRHTQQGGCGIIASDMREYIAASVPLHCADGWRFLGRALGCHLGGDAPSAVHFAYYAELRAAMALLASQGTGVFSNKHVAVGGQGKCEVIRGGTATPRARPLSTHVFVWEAFRHWSGLSRARQLLGSILAPGGVPLAEWVGELGLRAQGQGALANRWLGQWGLDLRRLSEDRGARNEASYRPSAIKSPKVMGTKEAVVFGAEAWALLEPTGASRFERMDRHLLRKSLEQAFKGLTGSGGTSRRYAEAVNDVVQSLGPGGVPSDQWVDFLTRQQEVEDAAVLQMAERRDRAGAATHHLQVISRAILLLRVATGACLGIIEQALEEWDDVWEDMRFWWQPFGVTHGLWEPGDEPDAMSDLWADVEQAIEDLLDWGSVSRDGAACHARLHREEAYPVGILGQGERALLWGLQP